MTDQIATVLVVDDETGIADLYSDWLAQNYRVRTAYSGKEALEKVDETVDVVLLDRRMPDLSGDDVLKRLRERDLDARVVMVTAIDPDVDIVDMSFDDYVMKPVTQADLEAVVETMLERLEYNETLREYFALSAKKATLETERSRSTLKEDEDYKELVRRVEEVREATDAVVDDLEDIDSLFLEVSDDG